MINPYLIEQLQKYPEKFDFTGIVTNRITNENGTTIVIRWFRLGFLNMAITARSDNGSDWVGHVIPNDTSFIEYTGKLELNNRPDYIVSFPINEELINLLETIKPSK